MDTVSIKKASSCVILSALSIVLLTITLSIVLSSNNHFLLNSSAEAQTVENNNTDSVIIPNNIRLNFSELFTRVESSVLQVTDPSTPGLLGPRLGSGFVYDKEGHIITNNHVVAGGSGDLDITFLDGTVYDARLIGSDPYSDLAVLKVEEDVPRDKLVPLPLGNSSTLKIGQPVAAVGNPFGLSGSITEGIISGLGRSLPSSVPQDPTIPQLDIPSLPAPPAFSIPDIIQTDAAINPGNSGGPLLNMRGEVIGINTAIFSNTGSYSGVGFAIPSNMIQKVVPSLITTGSYTHPYIGITGLDVTPEIAEAMGLQEARGFLVTDVTAEGPAAEAGIQGGDLLADINGREIELGGDVILEIDNKTVRTINDILTYLNTQKKVGDIVQLTVLRDGQLQEIPVTLAASSTLPGFANPEAPLQQPDESLPAPPSPPPPSQPPDNDGMFGNLYDECVKMTSKEICDLLFRR
jgi:S1-C subfamily serine protease